MPTSDSDGVLQRHIQEFATAARQKCPSWAAAGITLMKLVQRIREEFEEFPGLRVTVSEGARFWAIDEATCEQVLAYLLSVRFLTRSGDQRYVQAQF